MEFSERKQYPRKGPFLILSNKLKQGDSEMYGFVRARMSIAVMISNTLLLRGARYKEAYIPQRHDMADGLVMAMITLWRK